MRWHLDALEKEKRGRWVGVQACKGARSRVRTARHLRHGPKLPLGIGDFIDRLFAVQDAGHGMLHTVHSSQSCLNFVSLRDSRSRVYLKIVATQVLVSSGPEQPVGGASQSPDHVLQLSRLQSCDGRSAVDKLEALVPRLASPFSASSTWCGGASPLSRRNLFSRPGFRTFPRRTAYGILVSLAT